MERRSCWWDQPYSPDIALTYFHLFRTITHGLENQDFNFEIRSILDWRLRVKISSVEEFMQKKNTTIHVKIASCASLTLSGLLMTDDVFVNEYENSQRTPNDIHLSLVNRVAIETSDKLENLDVMHFAWQWQH